LTSLHRPQPAHERSGKDDLTGPGPAAVDSGRATPGGSGARRPAAGGLPSARQAPGVTRRQAASAFTFLAEPPGEQHSDRLACVFLWHRIDKFVP